jgi:hypothetical protein
MTLPLRQFFYHSRLSPDHNASCISAIVKTARGFNASHAITGVLVFDGEVFCQYIEGPADDLGVLVARLQADPRHTGFTELLSGESGERLFPAWSMAYAALDDEHYLRELVERPPQEALRHLRDTLSSLDVN